MACLAGSLLASRSAYADSSQAAAEAAFSEGIARLEAGEVSAACRQFESAVALTSRGALGGLLLLGDCYEKEERLASAWAVYKEVVPKARRAGQSEREAEANRKAAALEPRLARIKIVPRNASSVAQLSVTKNGDLIPQGLMNTALPVDAGSTLIEVSAPGYRTEQLQVEAVAGQLTEVQLPVLRATTDAPAAPPAGTSIQRPGPLTQPDRVESGGRSPVGLIVGGVGLLGMATAGVLGLVAKSNYDSALADDACTSAGGRVECDDPSGANAARDLGNTATFVLIGGGALTVVGGLIYLLSDDGSASTVQGASISSAKKRKSLKPGFAVGHQSAWLSLSGSL